MKSLSNTRSKRNAAFVVLLVWLFALASGVANACLLATPEMHSNPATEALPKSAHATAELVGHVGAIAGHGDDSDNSRVPCLKACDDGSHSLRNAHSGVDQTDPGPAPLVAILWTAVTPVVSAPRRLDDLQLPIVGPPFRVRYSRLAL